MLLRGNTCLDSIIIIIIIISSSNSSSIVVIFTLLFILIKWISVSFFPRAQATAYGCSSRRLLMILVEPNNVPF